MNNDVILEYLNNGMMDAKKCKNSILGSGLFAFLGLITGLLLGSYWAFIGIIMILTFAVCACFTLRLLAKELMLKTKLEIHAVIYACMYFQFGSLGAIVYTNTYGINYKLLFLYLPSFFLCLINFVITSKMLKSGVLSQKRNNSSKSWSLGLGLVAATTGWRLASFSDNTSNEGSSVPEILVCIVIINTLLSLGFANFQKLYYFHKISKNANN